MINVLFKEKSLPHHPPGLNQEDIRAWHTNDDVYANRPNCLPKQNKKTRH